MSRLLNQFLPYFIVSVVTFLVTLILTPIVREFNRRIGMIDKPDPRRINKVPIPRGGGIAIVVGVLIPYMLFHFVSNRPMLYGIDDAAAYRLFTLAFGIALLGFVDDRFSLPPKVKLAGQIVVAALAWGWAGLGFSALWTGLPMWLDGVLTVFWIVGAVNAFNLIDGLDGLASGLALIATLGMATGLFFVECPQATFFYFAFAGGLVAFLKYNYNPASVFLGDSGSMFIGFVISVLPLASQVPNSFLVSIGVPLLAMGVPIFDTFLAIMRRTLRHALKRSINAGESNQVMAPDHDHLHHRILRSVGLNQRKAAWVLYVISLALVLIGIVALVLKSKAAGLWMLALIGGAVIVFKDASIELFEAGRLLNGLARDKSIVSRRRFARFRVPFYVTIDLLTLMIAFLLSVRLMRYTIDFRVLKSYMAIRVVAVFACLIFFNTYRTAWSRAVCSNYVRLFLACVFGAMIGSAGVYYWPTLESRGVIAITVLFALISFIALLAIRVFRSVLRDMFYALDCSRLKARKDVSRILVYGSGLRYQAFRRELVRKSSANNRIIVGLLDDDMLMHGRYLGGIKVLGDINEAERIINEVNADTVIIACELTNEWQKVVLDILKPTGVKIVKFNFQEQEL